MRGNTLLPTALALLAGYLLMDLTAFFRLVNWSPDAPADQGVSLTVFEGAVTVVEYIPYNRTPVYFIGFCAVLAAIIFLAILGFRQAKRS